MSEVTLPMSLPLDSEGFLRRECPACERQFKWWASQPGGGDGDDAVNETVEAYFCPYCYEPAAPDAWWTKEQRAYAQQLVAAEVIGPRMRDLKHGIDRVNRPGSLVRVETQLSVAGRPDPLTELEDMVRIDVPCHPEEPLKVDDEWDDEVACLSCGIRYPVDLVRVLPDEPEEA